MLEKFITPSYLLKSKTAEWEDIEQGYLSLFLCTLTSSLFLQDADY